MFGLGFPELVMIFIVALILFGPKRLPELAKTIGSFLGNLRNAVEDVKNEFRYQITLDDEKKAIDAKYKELNEVQQKAEKKNEDIN